MLKIMSILLIVGIYNPFLKAMEPEQQATILISGTAFDNYNQKKTRENSSLKFKYCVYRCMLRNAQQKIKQLTTELALLKKQEEKAKKEKNKKTVESYTPKIKTEKDDNLLEKQTIQEKYIQQISHLLKQKNESDKATRDLRIQFEQQKKSFSLEIETLKKSLARRQKLNKQYQARNEALEKVHEENGKRWSDQLAKVYKENAFLRSYIKASKDKVQKEADRFIAMKNQLYYQSYKNWGEYLRKLIPPYKEN